MQETPAWFLGQEVLLEKEQATHFSILGLPWWLRSSKESVCNVGDLGSIPGLGKPPGGGHGNPLQSSCLENPMDRGAWWATVHRVEKSRTRLSNWAHTHVTPKSEHRIWSQKLNSVSPQLSLCLTHRHCLLNEWIKEATASYQYLLAAKTWARPHITFLSFSFLIFKIGITRDSSF